MSCFIKIQRKSTEKTDFSNILKTNHQETIYSFEEKQESKTGTKPTKNTTFPKMRKVSVPNYLESL
jgi:hypothetical protein